MSVTKIISINSPEFDLEALKVLFREYQTHIGINLEFQDFESELAALPGKYAQPAGNLYLAFSDEKPVGCVAYYPLSNTICELKRLFVQSDCQGLGIGKKLMDCALKDAKIQGYQTMRLDSLKRFVSAGKLYQTLGFQQTAPYNQNPYPDVYYMERSL